jgi:hypothetical protein
LLAVNHIRSGWLGSAHDHNSIERYHLSTFANGVLRRRGRRSRTYARRRLVGYGKTALEISELWRQVWPLAGLAVAVVANLAWIGFLIYAAYDLAILL